MDLKPMSPAPYLAGNTFIDGNRRVFTIDGVWFGRDKNVEIRALSVDFIQAGTDKIINQRVEKLQELEDKGSIVFFKPAITE